MMHFKYAFAIISGSVGIAIGHAFACLPVAIHKAYEVGDVSGWFKAWMFFVFVLGLPSLFVVEMPMAICVYLISYMTNVCHIRKCLRLFYFVALSLVFASGIFAAIKSSSIAIGLISSLSLILYFVVIIETARFCMKVYRTNC